LYYPLLNLTSNFNVCSEAELTNCLFAAASELFHYKITLFAKLLKEE
jgi:hypothetical protein